MSKNIGHVGMNSLEFDNYIENNSEYTRTRRGEYHIGTMKEGFYPVPSQDGTKIEALAAIAVFPLTKIDDDKTYNVVFGFDHTGQYYIFCGDRFIESGYKGRVALDVDERCEQAVTFADIGDTNILADQLLDTHNIVPDSSNSSHFWGSESIEVVSGKKVQVCKHINHVLTECETLFKTGSSSSVQEMLRDKMAQYSSTVKAASGKPKSKRKPSKTKASSGNELEPFAFKVPVLLFGDRGSGKTHVARQFAKDGGYEEVLLAGNPSLESADFLGHLIPDGTGVFAWKDGQMSKAFRLAASGKKTLLVLDELLRVNEKELSILLTALSPFEGNYCLPTGRCINIADGVAEEEVLEAPVENLCIVATTNVGSSYSVSEIDPAIKERFVPIQKDTTETQLLEILKIVAKKHKHKVAIGTNLLEFYKKMLTLKSSEMVLEIPTTRTLVRAMELASKESEISFYLKSMIPLWVDTDPDGKPVGAEVETVEKAIESIFGS